MGNIIRMNTEEFIKGGFSDAVDINQYQIVLVSESIKNNKKRKNICALRSLVPRPELISYYEDNKKKKYKNAYLEFLNEKEIDSSFVMPIVIGCKRDNMNIILLCSKDEDRYKYLKLLCKHIEQKHKIKTKSFDDLVEEGLVKDLREKDTKKDKKKKKKK